MASIYRRGKVYHGRHTYLGTEHRTSLKTEVAKVARDRLKGWVEKIEARAWGEKEDHTFDQAVIKFTAEHLPTLKPSSEKRYNSSIDNLTRHFEGMTLSSIRSAALSEFVAMRRADFVPAPHRKKDRASTGRRLSSATIRRDLHCLSSIFGMAILWEWVEANPVTAFLKVMKTRQLKEGQARTRYLSRDEEAALLAKASPYVANGIRFAIDTGLRKEEQFSRKWSHIDLDRNEVHIAGSTSKNARDRRVPLLPRTRALIQELPRSDVEYVFWHNNRGRYQDKRLRAKSRRLRPRRFLTMDRGLKAAAKRAGITDLRWHDLRRTCGCRLLQDHGLSIEKVSKWLGHSSIAVTQKSYAFLHVDQLHKAIERPPALERPVIEGDATEVLG